MHTLVWATSHCPTCDLWLHRSTFSKPRPQSGEHMHNSDEIIVVVKGEMMVGKARPVGTAIAIDANTIYGFGVPPDGMAFINFRAVDSLIALTEKGRTVTDWISEWDFLHDAAPIVLKKQAADA